MEHQQSCQTIPNIFWLAVPWSTLRSCPRFLALPATDQVAVDGENTHKYVRQGSKLWDCFHAGTLTTRYINAVLGFLEPMAANRLGISKNTAGHSALVEVHQYLVEASAWDLSKGADGASTPIRACQYNEELVRRCNRMVNGTFQSTEAHGHDIGGNAFLKQLRQNLEILDEAESKLAGASEKPHRSGKSKRRSKTAKAKPSAKGSGLLARRVRRILDDRHSQKVDGTAHCLHAASRGLQGVRLAWGELQEPTALFCLLSHMPDSWLCEAGLFYVDSLPEGTDVSLDELPRLGASPDCMIVHSVPLPEHMRGRTPPQKCTDLAREDLEILLASVPLRSGSELQRNGYCKFHGLNGDAASRLRDSLHNGMPFRRTCVTTDHEGAEWLQIAEVVEVKSSCPFSSRQTGKSTKWAYCQQGPRYGVPTQYVAQLQLEMLATGTMSALLVCHSAEKGVNIHRVFRDEEFLCRMIRSVRRFTCDFIRKTDDGQWKRPPLNMHWDLGCYQKLLQRTKYIARASAGIGLGEHLPSPAWEELAGAASVSFDHTHLAGKDDWTWRAENCDITKYPFLEVDTSNAIIRGSDVSDS